MLWFPPVTNAQISLLPVARQKPPACADGSAPQSWKELTNRNGWTYSLQRDISVCPDPANQGKYVRAPGTPGEGTPIDVTPKTNVCTNWVWDFTFEHCLWNPLMKSLGSWFLTLGATILSVAGALFDLLITHIVIEFGATLQKLKIMKAIEVGWTVFRDVSNILIIGIFVFIAISIIVGLKEFGQKRLIANVLIIAVLINFSLLFTKLIIDASNFTAFQVYKQMAQGSGKFDVSQAFLQPMGIGSIWDTRPVIDKFVKQQEENPANKTLEGKAPSDLMLSSQAFMFGLVGGIMLIAAAVVLLYGSFLIAARGILLIFLMLTASIAFATYLIPTFAKGEYGWEAWWKSLINAAIFAPLLMLFLAISVTIIKVAAPEIKGAGTLGAFIASPQSQAAGGWAVVFIYIIGIGLLFLSLKMSSKFAGTISGFSFAQMATALPFAAVLRGIAPLMRNAPVIGGRGAAARSMSLERDIEAKARAAAALPRGVARDLLNKDISKLIREKGKEDARAKQTYDAMNTGIGQALGKAVNLPGFLGGKTTTNFADSAKAAADHAAKEAVEAAVSKTDATQFAEERLSRERESERRELTDRHDTNLKLADAAKEMAQSAKQSEKLIERHATALEEEKDAKAKKLEAHAAFKSGRMSATDRDNELLAQNNRIDNARTSIQSINDRMAQLDIAHGVGSANEEVKETKKKLDDFEGKLRTDVDKMAQRMVANSRENAQKVGAELVHSAFTNTIARAIGIDPTNTIAARKAKGLAKKKIGAKGVKARQLADKEILDEAGESSGSAGGSTPPAPASEGHA